MTLSPSTPVPFVDALVRLTRDVPELLLHRGDTGVVISTWCSGYPAYEVEFNRPQESCNARVLLLSDEIAVLR